jgi:hypothetical protein
MIQEQKMKIQLTVAEDKLKVAEEKLKDFIVNDTEREALVNSTYDTAHDFVSLYDFSNFAESDDNSSHGAL